MQVNPDSMRTYGLTYPPNFLESLEKITLSPRPSPAPSMPPTTNINSSSSAAQLDGITKSPTPVSSSNGSLVPSLSPESELSSTPRTPVNKEDTANKNGSNGSNIYILPSPTFCKLHQSHLLNPPPDNVLFPFLHGLEGGNEGLCGFFLGGGVGGHSAAARRKVTVPAYRGLMWVICEDDLDNPEKDLRCLVHPPEYHNVYGLTPPGYDDDSESYFTSEDELDDLDEEDTSSESFSTEENGAAMDVDVAINDSSSPLSDRGNDIDDPNNAEYMHPIAHRPAPMTKPLLNTKDLPIDMEMPTSSSFASTASEDIDMEMDVQSPRDIDSASASLTLNSSIGTPATSAPEVKSRRERKRSQSQPPQLPPPILTCTFRPHELLRRIPRSNPRKCEFTGKRENTPNSPSSSPCFGKEEDFAEGVKVKVEINEEEHQFALAAPDEEEKKTLEEWSAQDPEWEYHLTPLMVPDGISLRNFGCQVAILASLSDIVVYSPLGKTQNAQRLAAHFREALERKRRERIANGHAPETLPAYNVFMLDAAAEEMRKDWWTPLCVRVKEGGAGTGRHANPDGGASWLGNGTVTSSPKLKDYFGDAKGMDIDQNQTSSSERQLSSITPSQQHGSQSHHQQVSYEPNTVDFARREREEMRELTRASEIIHVPVPLMNGAEQEDQLVGEMWLGNVNDVPLPVDTFTCHPDEGRDLEGLEGPDLEAKEWKRLGGSCANPPSNPLGFDICIECHDSALLPGKDHIRMVEERIYAMENAWAAHNSQRSSAPRPPPTAGNILHLPFPSSPPTTQNSVRDVIGVVKWLGGLIGVGEEWGDATDSKSDSASFSLSSCSTNSGATSGDTMNASQPNLIPSPTKSVSSSWSSLGNFIPLPSFPISWSSSGKGPDNTSSSKDNVPDSSTAGDSTANSASVAGSSSGLVTPNGSTTPRSRSFTSPAAANSQISITSFSQDPSLSVPPQHLVQKPKRRWSRPLKILVYSSDGYTESSVPALCLLMAFGVYGAGGSVPLVPTGGQPSTQPEPVQRGMTLPEAYLQLQLGDKWSDAKGKKKIGRSFFVYQSDLTLLRRVENELEKERKAKLRELEEKEKERKRKEEWGRKQEARERRGSFKLEEACHKERERFKLKEREGSVDRGEGGSGSGRKGLFSSFGTNVNPYVVGWGHSGHSSKESSKSTAKTRPSAKSVSFASPQSPPSQPIPTPPAQTQTHDPPPATPPQNGTASASVPSLTALPEHLTSPTPLFSSQVSTGGMTVTRPRSSTYGGSAHSALPGYLGNSLHEQRMRTKFFNEAWFNDSRFDGSFPSRVLDGVYLGNLNHASNVYMLQALGITHVVSVGECALIPPAHGHAQYQHQMTQHPFYPKGSAQQYTHNHHANTFPLHGHSNSVPPTPGSLFLEERAGRIKVLDIQGVCDDGIDTLDEGMLSDICTWIDDARSEGGQVLVHCRVGVSRSATVVIAYVMKSLNLPLVDAYLIVRSRRLSVLIQPNMRLLYNLCGWEVRLGIAKVEEKIAERRKLSSEQPWSKEREDKLREDLLKTELATSLSWPYLAKEVHRLNEKYLG
ncbi:hypothetical protein E1B28_010922 [Marasmius oreades]|uniref:Protein-tyrosine-phosphatase n=1 Tax=Marasmius oreades TaxID=181124 RepID=A0A9P7UQN7_9AGAR|nr:uncharacterized protein E1B28_010922 [Marasmius oreades]KAG7089221.1 hypothetical protein E1B28_010922 [Marasmius oreades]